MTSLNTGTGYDVQGRVKVNVFFNGNPFPLDVNGIDFVHIVESTRVALPMLTIGLKDSTHFLSQNNYLLDGTQIMVVINVAQQFQTTYHFRLFDHKEISASDPIKYKLYGMLDMPLYLSESVSEIYTGTSNEIISQIATSAGIKNYVGTYTTDSQDWHVRNLKFKDAVAKIARAGWVDEQSCMILAMTNQGQLRYVNISKFPTMPVVDNLVAPLDITNSKFNGITDYRMKNGAGFHNAVGGYEASMHEPSIIDPPSVHTKVDVVKNTIKMMVNKNVDGLIQQGRVQHAPIDVGNVHDNYTKGIYQNNRLANYMNMGCTYTTPDYSPANVLDIVSLQLGIPGDSTAPVYSGKYMVASKVVYVQGITYLEKFEVCRHGTNDNSDQTQV